MPILLDRAALVCVLLTPLLLLHAHAFAEVTIGLADAAFLLRVAGAGDWSWLRPVWMRLSLLWWGWLVLCSVPVPTLGLGEAGWGGFAQAVAILRFVVLLGAMQHRFFVRCGRGAGSAG